MTSTPILDLIQSRTGLDPDSLGRQALESAFATRMRALGLKDLGSYAACLKRDDAEFAALVDAIVVPESWFFRGGNLFAYLADHIRVQLSQRGPEEAFRVLSLPCSTGEEPYSLAIALFEAGLAPAVAARRILIRGIDISPRHLDQARRGIYGEMSFRQLPDELRQHYFRKTVAGWEIDHRVRASVAFRIGNIIDPGLATLDGPQDLVFCRNLFIYLNAVARQQAQTNLARLVTPGGLLCLGHADPVDGQKRFESLGLDGYFLHRRITPVVALPVVPRFVAAPASNVPVVPTPSLPTLGELLSEARHHADQGSYDEALRLCGLVEQRYGPSASLYTLAGIIHQARQDPGEATRSYQKALYLEPEHREALVHLMLLYTSRGEAGRAAVLRGRLERLPPDPGEDKP